MSIEENISQKYPHASCCTFGDSAALADHLATLIATGVKTASCGSLAGCIEDNAFPMIGEYKIVQNSAGEPVCVIRIIGLYLLRFSDVTEEFARKEGEGDLSLKYWRNEHRRFFEAEGSYSPEMDVIFEEYALIAVV
ncbi:ASCH domain-containing protein [Escherichia sp. E2593]|uniref:ASCH domain-containing protein n=1 Tax=unclassified Escherichia TaxID=2608889 RepID=UPI00102A299B|nr:MULTISPECIES: ASCH domain-containing protein [unclassified Escherichia]RZN37712.1 ASCH domain-containing protein [Escherichia sp. E10V5]TLI77358.1 ASCH domain-containing protein [Escherichia sp. E2593]